MDYNNDTHDYYAQSNDESYTLHPPPSAAPSDNPAANMGGQGFVEGAFESLVAI